MQWEPPALRLRAWGVYVHGIGKSNVSKVEYVARSQSPTVWWQCVNEIVQTWVCMLEFFKILEEPVVDGEVDWQNVAFLVEGLGCPEVVPSSVQNKAEGLVLDYL